jgi:hypothetical protein
MVLPRCVARSTTAQFALEMSHARNAVGVVGCSGGVLLSHDLAVAVPSALEGLASGFGMGPGVSPPLWPPEHRTTPTTNSCGVGVQCVDASTLFA